MPRPANLSPLFVTQTTAWVVAHAEHQDPWVLARLAAGTPLEVVVEITLAGGWLAMEAGDFSVHDQEIPKLRARHADLCLAHAGGADLIAVVDNIWVLAALTLNEALHTRAVGEMGTVLVLKLVTQLQGRRERQATRSAHLGLPLVAAVSSDNDRALNHHLAAGWLAARLRTDGRAPAEIRALVRFYKELSPRLGWILAHDLVHHVSRWELP